MKRERDIFDRKVAQYEPCCSDVYLDVQVYLHSDGFPWLKGRNFTNNLRTSVFGKTHKLEIKTN